MSVEKEHVCRIPLITKPVFNVAFAIDDCDTDHDECILTMLVAGVSEDMLSRLASSFCGENSLSKRYTIERRKSPVWRNGVISEWEEIRLEGYNPKMADTETIAILVERWFRNNLKVNYVDCYTVDDFLNLKGHDATLALNIPKPKKKEQEKTINDEDMPNIYLKVPWYVAWHFRGRCEEHQLTEWEPVKFNDFDHEYQVLVNNLRLIPEPNQSRLCYSQSAWKNILRGRVPDGTKLILQRDPKEWPTPAETAVLTGCQLTGQHNSSDYLCIEMPKESYINKKVYRTNASYALSHDVASYFRNMLCDKYCYEYTQFVEEDTRFAREQGFRRKISELQERYFTQFNFPVIIDPIQRESLRRQHSRFMSKGFQKPRYGLQFDQGTQDYMAHVGEHEERRIQRNQRKGRWT